MTVLGVVIALPGEGRALTGKWTWRADIGGRVCRMSLSDGGLVIARRKGIGPDAARETARRLAEEGATVLASLGVAGGLQPGLSPGTVVIAETVIDPEGVLLRTDARWADWWADSLAFKGIPFRRGDLCSVERPVLTAGGKAQLHRQSGALALDMESAAVAWAAREAGIPFFGLRAVCDPAQRSLSPDMLDALSSGTFRPAVLLRRLAHRPALGVELVRVAMDYSAALAALKRAWRSGLRSLPGPAPVLGERLRKNGRTGKFGGSA